jgi:hypothetical protein
MLMLMPGVQSTINVSGAHFSLCASGEGGSQEDCV